MEQATNPGDKYANLVAAGYTPGTKNSMDVRARTLMEKPHIQLALSEVIAEQYPNASSKVAKILDRL